ncbi:hypothetical protein V7S43_016441 [Phytophthora oleae]|uniref:Uncharacterized protein n=1 Tax=Phytophthora oleae TaxID=2107226 RepID=A0ABD3EW91_9STRA
MLVAFYLACIEKKEVLVIRRLKGGNAVVFFDGQGSYKRLGHLSPTKLFAVRKEAADAIVLVDGFNQKEIDSSLTGLEPFRVLATSCQFDVKPNDSAHLVVLPAWRRDDLLKHAELTDWVVDTEISKTKDLRDSELRRFVKQQYFYSGGSLREFCKKRAELKLRASNNWATERNDEAFELVSNYRSAGQADLVRRHYVIDPTNKRHYFTCRGWALSVDSGYVMSNLGRKIDMDKQLSLYKCAKFVGAGFHDVAFEVLFHNAVNRSTLAPVVLAMKSGLRYEKIEIQVPKVIRDGCDEETCYSCLKTLEKDTYWTPDYPFFPFIDAVTTCEAFTSEDNSETIVAYIVVTIRRENVQGRHI